MRRVALALKKEDIFFGNHRSHGHYLAKGGNIKKCYLKYLEMKEVVVEE